MVQDRKVGTTQATHAAKEPRLRGCGELILKLVIALIAISWFMREYIQSRELDPISLIVLLIVLALIVWLILRQRHVCLLKCELTSPPPCVKGETQILQGRILEPVLGSAHGLGFSHYLLELTSPGGNLLSDVVIYPDAAQSPDTAATRGNFPVNPGTLGWIDIEKAVNDSGIELLTSTTFVLRLRVFCEDDELTPNCIRSFDVSVNEVYIKDIGRRWAPDYTNPAGDLRVADDVAAELGTIGGSFHVRGAANVYGCASEKIQEYTIWAIPDDDFSFVQPPPFTAVTPGADWVQATHIDFNAQVVGGTPYTADDVRAYNELDGDPNPDILTTVWGVRQECISILVDFTVQQLCWQIPDLKNKAFGSSSLLKPHKLSPSHDHGTGKFTFLLQVIDTAGNQFYDIQRAWVDNETIQGKITGLGGLPGCTDLYAKDKKGNFKMVDVKGTAWDALIDPGNPPYDTTSPTPPDLTKPTSDNFHHYTLAFQKQGAAAEELLVDSPNPVPARPANVAVGTLFSWDLETINQATNPLSAPADQLLGEGESCTYDLILRVWDRTKVSEGTVHWSGEVNYPIKIINSSEP